MGLEEPQGCGPHQREGNNTSQKNKPQQLKYLVPQEDWGLRAGGSERPLITSSMITDHWSPECKTDFGAKES